jgi:spore maturation protein SpmA
MKIGENGGIVSIFNKVLGPFLRKIFPEIPPNHPSIGPLIMNISANMLGLDNAATPIGLKAMKELQTLNAEKDTASDAMIMFLAINTSSVTIVPAMVMFFRASTGSKNPQIILGPAILATICSTAAGITAAYLMARFAKPTRDYYNEYLAGKDIDAIAAQEAQKGSETV